MKKSETIGIPVYQYTHNLFCVGVYDMKDLFCMSEYCMVHVLLDESLLWLAKKQTWLSSWLHCSTVQLYVTDKVYH